MVSGSIDRSVRIWNAITGEMERVLEGHPEGVTSVAFSSDGTRVVSERHVGLNLECDHRGDGGLTGSFELGDVSDFLS